MRSARKDKEAPQANGADDMKAIEKRRKAAALALMEEERKLKEAESRRLEEERKLKIAESKRIVRIEEERKLKVAESLRIKEERKAAESMRKAQELMTISEELKAFEEERASKIEAERQRLEAELAALAKALSSEEDKRRLAEARTLAAEQKKREAEEEQRIFEEKRTAAAEAFAVEEARRVEAEERKGAADRARREAEEKTAAAIAAANAARVEKEARRTVVETEIEEKKRVGSMKSSVEAEAATAAAATELKQLQEGEDKGKGDGDESMLICPSSPHSSSSSMTFSSACTPIKASEEYSDSANQRIPTSAGVCLMQPMTAENEGALEKDKDFASPNPADSTMSTASPSHTDASLDESSRESTTTAKRLLRQSTPPPSFQLPQTDLTPTFGLSRQGPEALVDDEGTEVQLDDDSSSEQRSCEVKLSQTDKQADPVNYKSQKSVTLEDAVEAGVKVDEADTVQRDLAIPFGAALAAESGEERSALGVHAAEEDGEKEDADKVEGKATEGRVPKRRRRYIIIALLVIVLIIILSVAIKKSRGKESPASETSSADFSETSTSVPAANPTSTPMPAANPTQLTTATLEPTPLRTLRPTVKTAMAPTQRPAAVPTMAPKVSTLRPTEAPKKPLFGVNGHSTFSFYVMGDGPYSEEEHKTLQDQLDQLSVDADPEFDDNGATFMVHIGDILRRNEDDGTTCERRKYELVKESFLEHSSLPSLILPGEDDWLKCPTPGLGWQRWEDTFMSFERNWSNSSPVPATVERDDKRIENFAFTHNGVLFIGVNVIRADEGLKEQELDEVTDLLKESARWVEDQVDKYDFADGKIRAIVMFGHAYWRRFFKGLQDVLQATNVPTLYIHGNGKTFDIKKDFNDNDNGWGEFWSVQVDQLGMAPPIKVTVRGTTDRAKKDTWRIESSDDRVFRDFIRLDRQGGTKKMGKAQSSQLTFVGTCENIGACQLCQGDCDDDSGCEGDLKCFQRDVLEPVPGCEGVGVPEFDYCYKPE